MIQLAHGSQDASTDPFYWVIFSLHLSPSELLDSILLVNPRLPLDRTKSGLSPKKEASILLSHVLPCVPTWNANSMLKHVDHGDGQLCQ